MKNSVIIVIGIILVLFGAFSLVVNVVSVFGHIQVNNIELPLSIPRSIAVDNNGRIYCGLNGYCRIQMYSQEGKFIKGWPVDTGGGDFRIYIDKNNNLMVLTNSRVNLFIFNSNGEILKTASIELNPFDYFNNKSERYQCKDRNGNLYQILSGIVPKIIKTNTNGTKNVVLSMPWQQVFFSFPISLIIFALGIGLNAYMLLFKKKLE
ncbi:MAG: hypothetical protein K6U80_19945 [Firmicutes bacterium]|nr:hypothetical protein [Bacillota bacterium]